MASSHFRDNVKEFSDSLLAGLAAWIVSIFLYSPRLINYLGEGSAQSWTRRDDLLLQCIDPLTRDLARVKLGYRIVQPFLAYLLGWCGERRAIPALLGSPGIAYIALGCCHWALNERAGNTIALLTVFCLGTTMFTQWTNLYWGHPDSLSFLAIAILMCTKRVEVSALASFIGALNDERFLLALPFIALWWWPQTFSVRQAFRAWNSQFWGIGIGLLCWFILRIALTQGWIGDPISDPYVGDYVGSEPLRRLLNPKEWPSLVVMVFLGYRWLWVIPALAIYVGFSSKGGFDLRIACYALAIAVGIVACFSMADVSRSLAFMFPIVLIGVLDIAKNPLSSQNGVKKLLLLLLAANVVTPAAIVFTGPGNYWLNPLSSWLGYREVIADWANQPILPLPLNLWQFFSLPQGAPSF